MYIYTSLSILFIYYLKRSANLSLKIINNIGSMKFVFRLTPGTGQPDLSESQGRHVLHNLIFRGASNTKYQELSAKCHS